MTTGIFFRSGLVLVLSLSAWLVYRLIVTLSLRKANRETLFLKARWAKATLIYFTTPDCVACKTVQKPAIEKLKELLGTQVEIVEIDACAEPELAKAWGVLSVPTTFILDKHGTARQVNFGVTPLEKLLEQVNL